MPNFTIDADDPTWEKRRVRPITERIRAVPGANLGAARGTFVHALCTCVRCIGKRRMVNVNATPRTLQSPASAVVDATRFADAILAREAATLGSLYSESIRMLHRFGEEYFPLHLEVLEIATPNPARSASGALNPGWRSFDRDMTREIKRDAREAARHSRTDAGPTDVLPRKAAIERARPTFYPTKDSGSQDGFEAALSWQTLSQATQAARHGASLVAIPNAEDQWSGARDLLNLAVAVDAGSASVADLGATAKRLHANPSLMDQVYSRLRNAHKRKLTKLMRESV